MKNKYIEPWVKLFNDQILVRLDKRQKMEERGSNPYKTGLKPNIKSAELIAKYAHLDKAEIVNTPDYKVAGRAMLVRDFGKAAFVQIDDGSSRFQIYVHKGATSEAGMEEYKSMDFGDIVYAEGDIFKTNKGELSLNAKDFKILSKSIRPLPEKFHGLTDHEQRYRMRYVDLAMNEETRMKLKKRSEIVRYIREFFFKRDYLEVETPMMHSISGGAAARPFKTHHNALDMELFMRIAPELYLKRLIVGGYNRVFEMNRCFRNEGLSLKHNPEFTSIEFYEAYATYEDLMNLTEDLLSGLATEVMGSETVTFGEHQISFKKPFRRLALRDSVKEFASLTDADLKDKNKLISMLLKKDMDKKTVEKMSLDKLMVTIFEEYVEGKLIQPTFITDYPTEISPLARKKDTDPNYVDRFELFINGWEVANAFNELNNPTDQLDRFADQAMLKEDGDLEASEPDYDYVRALEYGMPPTAGQGIGIDRLTMILTNSSTIRDVILFPLLKKEHFFGSNEEL